MGRLRIPRSPHPYVIVLLQIVFIVLFGVLGRYASVADASDQANSREGTKPDDNGIRIYNMFQDVHVMIFVGFGFLMTFLKRYGLSSVSINFLLAAFVLEWAILVNGFFHLHHGHIEIDIVGLLAADFTAATILISFGVVLGKTTPTQLLVMALIEVPIFVINEVIGRKYLKAVDMGDSMFVHAFGAYFGLAVSLVLNRKDSDSPNAVSNSVSDLFSMIGTIFLWCFWPSFNSALAPGDDQHRAVINTYLSLCGSCVVTFAISALLNKQGKFTMEHVQNATLAGGVAIGTASDMMVQPYGALIVGSLAGLISVIGFEFITPALAKYCRTHDTCGVNNLHGMPGLLAGIIGAIVAAMASEQEYHGGLYTIFPARAPIADSPELTELQDNYPFVAAGSGRTASYQGGMQILALLITLAMAIVGGLITGLVMRLRIWERLETRDLYSDQRYFVVHDEEEDDAPHAISQSGNHGQTKDTHM